MSALIPLGRYTEVCENWCYYVYCKQNGDQAAWTVKVARQGADTRRGGAQCKKVQPNKCSNKGTGDGKNGKWPKHKHGWDCDEQPKASNAQGGAGAATRCIDPTENRSEGLVWMKFINGKTADQPDYLDDTTPVNVVLDDSWNGGLCKSLHHPDVTVCPQAASPNDPGVENDLERQQ
ncbi:hypothetical protein PsYK624_151310 [Phanerochaete sordida]|uniref:Deoxyribonuclease NucA/NucB domain-containing protein n=1 Tax=Phanerochaete sordida TaxID=48140 RepID=A0A9P3GR96_9APHY|nr:hypothetical protein PsYK624_151310 [Phanerochaete sordida]